MVDYCKNISGATNVKMVIVTVLLVLFTVFVLQNTDVVEIRFLTWEMKLSRVVLLLGSLLTGILVGLFLGWEKASKKKKQK